MPEAKEYEVVEILLRRYYRTETSSLPGQAGLWLGLERRLGQQERPSLLGRLQTLLAAPLFGGAIRGWAVPALAGTAAVVVLAIALAQGLGQQRAAPSGDVAAATPRAPVVVAQQTATTPPSVVDVPASDQPVLGLGSGDEEAVPGKTYAQASGAPALAKGTIEEVERATGVGVLLPAYLPEGAIREQDETLLRRPAGWRLGLGFLPGGTAPSGPALLGSAELRGLPWCGPGGRSRPLRRSGLQQGEGAFRRLTSELGGGLARRRSGAARERRPAGGGAAQGGPFALRVATCPGRPEGKESGDGIVPSPRLLLAVRLLSGVSGLLFGRPPGHDLEQAVPPQRHADRH